MYVRTVVLAAAALAAALPATAQTADEIVARHIVARGGLEKLQSLQSIRMTGKMSMGPGMEVPCVLEMKRPNMMRLDMTVQGTTGTQAFDGTDGWVVMPFAGIAEPDRMPADVAKEALTQADFDGPLVDYKTKGHRVELLGKQAVDDRQAWTLEVTLKGGGTRRIYVDADSYLEIGSAGARNIRGTSVEAETRLGDYRPTNGIMFPHTMETGLKGQPQREKMTIDKVELNVSIDDTRFRMPTR
jgi:outer membrane lipoprotein-sorting protein